MSSPSRGSSSAAVASITAIDRAEQSASVILRYSFVAAIVVELGALAALTAHFSMKPAPVAVVSMAPIEATIFEKPHEAHLSEEKPVHAKRAAAPEPIISKTPSVGKEAAKAAPLNLPTENVVDNSKPAITSHGPVVVSSVSPKLPSYLKDQNLKTSVLIEFVVGSDGSSTPHLLGSSGNEELDAIALKSAEQWHFNPAVKDNQPVTSKVRLRINFEVQ
jgi:TonB family protein